MKFITVMYIYIYIDNNNKQTYYLRTKMAEEEEEEVIYEDSEEEQEEEVIVVEKETITTTSATTTIPTDVKIKQMLKDECIAIGETELGDCTASMMRKKIEKKLGISLKTKKQIIKDTLIEIIHNFPKQNEGKGSSDNNNYNSNNNNGNNNGHSKKRQASSDDNSSQNSGKRRRRWVSDDEDDKRWVSDDEDDDNYNNNNNNYDAGVVKRTGSFFTKPKPVLTKNNNNNKNRKSHQNNNSSSSSDDRNNNTTTATTTATTTTTTTTTTRTDFTDKFLEDATLLKRKGDAHLRDDNVNYAAKAYLESGILYMKHCNKSMVNGNKSNKKYYKILRQTAKILITSGKLFEQRSLWNETVLAFESSAALSLICSKENLSKMNMIRNTILNKSELKKEHRKLAYEYIKYTTDVLNSQHYYNKAQKILEQHKVVIVGYQNDTNSNDATVKSYLSLFADYDLSYCVDRIEHYYYEC